MNPYAVAYAAILTDLQRCGYHGERDQHETRIVCDGHTMARTASSDDALADLLRVCAVLAGDVIVCHAEACGLGGEA